MGAGGTGTLNTSIGQGKDEIRSTIPKPIRRDGGREEIPPRR